MMCMGQHWNIVLNINTHLSYPLDFVSFRVRSLKCLNFIASVFISRGLTRREEQRTNEKPGSDSIWPIRGKNSQPWGHEALRERGRKSPKTSIRVASSNFYLLRLASVWLLIGGDWSCDLNTVLWLARRNSSLIISECPGRWQESIGQLPWPPFIVLSNSWEYLH